MVTPGDSGRWPHDLPRVFVVYPAHDDPDFSEVICRVCYRSWWIGPRGLITEADYDALVRHAAAHHGYSRGGRRGRHP
jgi:hypothetical protein